MPVLTPAVPWVIGICLCTQKVAALCHGGLKLIRNALECLTVYKEPVPWVPFVLFKK